MNIYEKMAKATAEIETVAKNLQVGVGSASYKAVGEADVLTAVKPIEEKYGIYSYPLKRELVESNAYTTTQEYKGETKEKLTIFMRLKTTYRFVNIEKPEEFIDIECFGDGVDTQDKAPGKAMTYADKYALMKAYKIRTGDDPDQFASKEMHRVTRITPEQKKRLQDLGADFTNLAKRFHKASVDELTTLEADQAIQIKLTQKFPIPPEDNTPIEV